MRQAARPAAVPQRVYLHPHPVAPGVQLQRPRAAGRRQVPVAATWAAGQHPLAAHHRAAAAALLQDLVQAEVEVELEHRYRVAAAPEPARASAKAIATKAMAGRKSHSVIDSWLTTSSATPA